MVVTNYLWAEDSYLEEYDEVGTTTMTYTSAPTKFGNIISQHSNSTTSFYQYDSQGSTHQLTNQNEDVTDTFLYDSWGNIIERTGSTTTPFRYIGEYGYYYNAETESYYVRTRIYKPMIARWLSVDPLGFIDGLNLYSYVRNIPDNLSDPKGTFSIPPIPEIPGGGASSDPKGECEKSGWKPKPPSECTYGNNVRFAADFIMYDEDKRPGCVKCKTHLILHGGGPGAPHPPPPRGNRCVTRFSWPIDCVCSHMPNSEYSNCVRGCIRCIYDSKGIAPNDDEHDWCFGQCGNFFQKEVLKLKLLTALQCCASKQGASAGPASGDPAPQIDSKPNSDPNLDCDQCGSGTTPLPRDCSGY